MLQNYNLSVKQLNHRRFLYQPSWPKPTVLQNILFKMLIEMFDNVAFSSQKKFMFDFPAFSSSRIDAMTDFCIDSFDCYIFCFESYPASAKT